MWAEPGEKRIWGGKCPCCLADNYFVTSNTCPKKSKEGCHIPSVLWKGVQLWRNDGVKGGKMSLGYSGLQEGSFHSLFNKYNHLASLNVKFGLMFS